MADLEVFQEDFALLFEAGMIAVKQGDEDSAKKIFESLRVLNPAHYGYELGLALIDLHKMKLTAAEERLSVLAEQESENWSVKAFLAFADMMIVMQDESSFDARRKSLERCVVLAHQVLAHCQEESTRALAQSVLEWHDSLLAKSGPLG